MIKTEDRLSRNLDDEDFTEEINEQICRLGAAKVTDDMVIAIDPGDIRKKYARKMEFLGKVYDGSEHEVGNGYHLCKIVAADIESTRMIPLYCEAYSYDAVKSENTELLHAIGTVESHIGHKGIHAIDRGGDREVICKHYLSKDTPGRFVIRLKERNLMHKGKRKHCLDMATTLPMPHESVLIFYDDGKEKRRAVKYNAVAVKLPDYEQKLFLIVVKGVSLKPMMLLTSCQVNMRKKESISGRSLNTIWPEGNVMSRSGISSSAITLRTYG